MKTIKGWRLTATSFLVLGVAGVNAAQFTLQDLGTLGGTSSSANGINNSGQVVGTAYTTGNAAYRAFLHSGGVMTDLGTLGGPNSAGSGINNAGQVVGYSYTANAYRAFRYSEGVMTDLGTLGGSYSLATGINDAGQVVGQASIAGEAAYRAFRYSGGMMTDLGTLGGTNSIANGINAGGQVVGATDLSLPRSLAFQYSGGVMAPIVTLGTNSRGFGINNAGQVVGDADIANDLGTHAFRYSEGVMTDLGTLGGTVSRANAINNSGHVVGSSYLAGNAVSHAFLYSGGTMTDLNTLIPSGSAFQELSVASGINDLGQIVGTGRVAGQERAFLFTVHELHLQPGSGADPNFTLGFTPSAIQAVFIDPDSSRTIAGLGGGSLAMSSLTIGTKVSGTAELKLTSEVATSVTNYISVQSRGALTLEKGTQTAAALINAGTVSQAGASQLTLGYLTNTGTATLSGKTTLGTLFNLTAMTLDNANVSATAVGVVNDYGAQMTARGAINLSNGATFTNNGALVVNGILDVVGGQTLNGGAIAIGALQSLRSFGGLTNQAGANITGLGSVIGNVTNDGGLIHATGGTLTFSGGTAENVNGGELRVDDGSTLRVVRAMASSGEIVLKGSNALLTGGAVTNTGTLRGAGRVTNSLLNTGVIRTEGGSLTLSGAGGTNHGEIEVGTGATVMYSQGLAINAGTIALLGGRFDNNNRPMVNTGTIGGNGALATGGLINSTLINFAGGATSVFGHTSNGGSISVTGSTVTFYGGVGNFIGGSIKNTGGVINFLGGFSNAGAYVSDPADNFFTDLAVSETGFLAGGKGDRFFVSGDFDNASTRASDWDTDAAELAFVTGGSHRLGLMGLDLGASYLGYADNFAWGILHLGSGQTLTLLDGGAAGGALYLGALVLDGGIAQLSSLFSGGLNIYYDPTLGANAYLGGLTYQLVGGGILAASTVPEPGTVLLFVCGLAGLAAARVWAVQRDLRT